MFRDDVIMYTKVIRHGFGSVPNMVGVVWEPSCQGLDTFTISLITYFLSEEECVLILLSLRIQSMQKYEPHNLRADPKCLAMTMTVI